MTASKIEWTDRTWNPVSGCTKVSPGCDRCYAEGIARRFAGGKAYPNGFDVTLRPHKLDAPLRWREPQKVFVNSMSDLFHDHVPDQFIARVFAVMAATPQHTYQVLTKRHGRMRSLLSTPGFLSLVADAVRVRGEVYSRELVGWPLPNVWLGVSVEDQKRADLRIPVLLDTPAAVRFLSCEPLLGPLDLSWCDGVSALEPDWGPMTGAPHPLIDWVIVGGESGPGARPMHPDWAREIRDQCTTATVPFFFKQWGRWAPDPVGNGGWRNVTTAGEWVPYRRDADDGSVPMAPTFKAPITLDGRALDGRTWDEFPRDLLDRDNAALEARKVAGS